MLHDKVRVALINITTLDCAPWRRKPLIRIYRLVRFDCGKGEQAVSRQDSARNFRSPDELATLVQRLAPGTATEIVIAMQEVARRRYTWGHNGEAFALLEDNQPECDAFPGPPPRAMRGTTNAD
jgi:hypothetical protein